MSDSRSHATCDHGTVRSETLRGPREHEPPGNPTGLAARAIRGEIAAVGSRNPVKVSAAEQAFVKVYSGRVEVRPTAVPSGISDQPMSTEETLLGATNRARRARAAVDGEYGVGLEGGLTWISGHWYCVGWAVVADWAGGTWAASTAGLLVPDAVMDLVRSGLELGDAEDRVFGRVNSKQNGGLVGIVTGELVGRTELFVTALITAICSMRLECGEINV